MAVRSVCALAFAGRVQPSAAQVPGAVNATLTASPATPQAGQPVTFSYTVSPPAVAPPFPSVQNVVIDYGDGQTDVGVGGLPGATVIGATQHVYLVPGTYQATLRAAASNGAVGFDTAAVSVGGGVVVVPGSLAVTLTANTPSALSGQPVTFTYAATPPSVAPPFPAITSVVIDYGDDQFDTGPAGLPGQTVAGSFSHVYLVPGTFTASVRAAASNGQNGADSATVVVGQGTSPIPGTISASLQANPTTAPVGQSISFLYTVSPPAVAPPFPSITSLLLDYGDGQSELGPIGDSGQTLTGSFTHAYKGAGTYVAKLVATGSNASNGADQVTITVTGSPTPVGPTVIVNHPAGWNLVGVPAGGAITGTVPPYYTYQAGDTAYQTAQTLQPGLGYWANLPAAATSNLPVTGPVTVTKSLPAGQYIMIGNPGSSSALVAGADVVYTYSATAGYQATMTLQPGQGAWALSSAGGTATVSSGP
jgi:hypothetical protein